MLLYFGARNKTNHMIVKRIKELFQEYPLPDFIIIGAQKSGTSSLYTYLAQHPQLIPSSRKEVHYFDAGLNPNEDNYKKGENWYRSHFPAKKDLEKNQKTFEASPLYMFNPDAPERIHDLIPRVKLIAVLRNPTERAISQYFHERRLKMEPLPILQAMQEEESRLKLVNKTKDYKDLNFIHSTYKSRGVYHIQLARYLKYFSREQLLVLNSDELFQQTENVLKKVFEYISVDPGFKVKDLEPRNTSNNRVEVGSEVYEYLDEFFKPHNQALFDLLGVEFDW